MAKGYIIANIEVRDPAGFEAYRAAVPAVIERFGGRYLVRGGAIEVVEGEPGLKRVVVLEFPSVAAAREFLASPDYAPVLKLRLDSAETALAIVEGVAG